MPFLLTGLAINHFLVFYSRFRKHLHKVEVFSGLALILIGGAIASGYATRLASSRLASMLPNLEARIRPAEVGVPVVANGEALEQAPQIELETVDGKTLNLESLHGHVVLLNFWATWCGPCRDEIPELNSLQHDLSASGLKVIGVSWDDSGEGIRQFQTEIPQDYTVALGGENFQAQFAGIRSLPATIVIDREGRIRQKIIGARDKKGFASVVEPLLNETPKTND